MDKLNNINKDLLASWKKVTRYNNNSGSFKTKKTYREEQKQFLSFVSKEFNLKSVSRISDKHIKRFIEHKLSNGCSKRYLQKTMTAIRQLCNNSGAAISVSNKDLGIYGRKLEAKEGFRQQELERALSFAKNKLHSNFIYYGLLICSEFGLRSNELINLRRRTVINALSGNILHLEHGTKGGRPRDVSVATSSRYILEEILNISCAQGIDDKVFCSNDKGAPASRLSEWHNFFSRYSNKFADADRDKKLGAHDLRRKWANDKYLKLRKEGKNDTEAMAIVSMQLGHSAEWHTDKNGNSIFTRNDITKLYVYSKCII